MTGIAIFTIGTAAVFVAVKAGLSPHEHFKRTAAAVRKVTLWLHLLSDLGRKKRRRLFSKSTAWEYAKRDAALR